MSYRPSPRRGMACMLGQEEGETMTNTLILLGVYFLVGIELAKLLALKKSKKKEAKNEVL